jgi:hypothetical protein
MKKTKAELLHTLRQAGLSDVADEIEPVLPDIVDFDRDYRLLERYGLEQDVLMSRMGASP